MLLTPSFCIRAQDNWKVIAPFGESFTVSMPTSAQMVVRVVPLTETEKVPARVLYSLARGRRYAVVMFRRTTDACCPQLPPPPPGPPNRPPPLSNFAEFVTAMEWSLTKAQTGKVILDKDFSDQARVAKQYELQINDTTGVVRFVEAGNSFYAQFVIGADKNDLEARRFLSSLQIGKTNNDD